MTPESALFLQLEMEPALLAFLGDDFKSRRLGQFDEMGTPLFLDELHAVSRVDVRLGTYLLGLFKLI